MRWFRDYGYFDEADGGDDARYFTHTSTSDDATYHERSNLTVGGTDVDSFATKRTVLPTSRNSVARVLVNGAFPRAAAATDDDDDFYSSSSRVGSAVVLFK